MALAHSACSILDPFCVHAYGARLAGDAGQPTITVSSHFTTQITTDTTNAKTFFFWPDWNLGYGTATAAAGVTTTPSLTAFPIGTSGSTVANYLNDARVTSAGFIVRNTTAAMSVMGSYIVVPLQRCVVGGTFTGTPALADPRAVVIQATKSAETAVVCLRRGYGALDFHAALDGTLTQPDYGVWAVYLPATSTAQTYEIECFVHVEGVLNLGQENILSFLAPQGGHASQASLSLADKISSKIPQVVSSAAGSAAKVMTKAIEDRAMGILAGAGTALVTRNPSAAVAAYQWANAIEVD